MSKRIILVEDEPADGFLQRLPLMMAAACMGRSAPVVYGGDAKGQGRARTAVHVQL